MKKVMKFNKKNFKKIKFVQLCCYEFGAGSTYRNELRVLFFCDDETYSITYKYTLENVLTVCDIVNVVKFDRKILRDMRSKLC